MDRRERSLVHAALGDEGRLALVDLLVAGDRSVQELAEQLNMRGNLLAHHLDVLDSAGLISRRVSEGDRRRRYVVLNRQRLTDILPGRLRIPDVVVFVCSHNSARSQYAAARWEQAITGSRALSAGSDPAPRVNPTATRIARELGVDLSSAVPRGYESVDVTPDLLVSVCDRAREGELPEAGVRVHWSIPDPVAAGGVEAFRQAFSEIDSRIDAFL